MVRRPHQGGIEPDFVLDGFSRSVFSGLRLPLAFVSLARVYWLVIVAGNRHWSIEALRSGHGRGHHLAYPFSSLCYWRAYGPDVTIRHCGGAVTKEIPQGVRT